MSNFRAYYTLVKRIAILISLVVIATNPARVGAEGIVSDAQLATIRDHCRYAQQQMRTTATADGVLRYNQALQYDALLTKLMTPFNSRLALNRIDSVALAETTLAYQKKVSEFRSQYFEYANKLEQALTINCQDRPLEFYQALAVARDERRQVGTTINAINDMLLKYRQQVKDMAVKLPGGER